jgi:hypothetical protein
MLFSPPVPLAYVNKPKVLVTAEGCHIFSAANISMKRTVRRLDGNE